MKLNEYWIKYTSKCPTCGDSTLKGDVIILAPTAEIARKELDKRGNELDVILITKL